MSTSDIVVRTSQPVQDQHWGQTFLNRFDLKVRSLRQITHPRSGDEFKVDPGLRVQLFRRTFGEVAQLTVATGLIRKMHLVLSAVRLEGTGLASTGDFPGPAQDVFQQIAGLDGLDFQDEKFYCVGIFSPVGWPAEWKGQEELKGNALFYLVEKATGTRWNVVGPDHAVRDLFDPESQDEKRARAEKALAGHASLILRGDQIAMNDFLEEESLNQETVRSVVESSDERFQIIEHNGKHYILRSLR